MLESRPEFRIRLTATNVEEVIAASKEEARKALLNVCQKLLADGDCIQPHHGIIKLLIRDYERHGRSNWKSLGIRARAYEQEIVNREAARALSAEQKAAAKQGEKQFKGVFEAALSSVRKTFRRWGKRPATFAELLARLQVPGGAFCRPMVRHGHSVGNKPTEDKLRRFVAECPPFRCLLLALSMAQYERCIRDTKTGESYRAGRSDLLCAVYLPYCDQFITADERQERCLREIASLAGLGVAIRPYADFREGFLF